MIGIMGFAQIILFVTLWFCFGNCTNAQTSANDAREFMTMLSKARILDRFQSQSDSYTSPVLEFSWSNCGHGDPVVISALAVHPDPIKLPGDLILSFNATTAINLTSPLKLDLKIEKNYGFGFWVEIPCVDNVGSCTYDNLCSLLPSKPCDPALNKYGIPCHCPVKQGTYLLPGITLAIPATGLPSFLTDGDFKVKAEVSGDGRNLACYEIEASITKG